jgi:hypothetical protein
MIYPLLINPRQLEKRHEFDAAVSALIRRLETRRTSHRDRDFVLQRLRVFTCCDDPFQQRIVGLLELGGSRFSSPTRFDGLPFCAPSVWSIQLEYLYGILLCALSCP